MYDGPGLRWIVSRYAKGPEGPVVVVCTPPPIDESRRLHVTTKIKGMPPELLDRSAAGIGPCTRPVFARLEAFNLEASTCFLF